MKVAYHIPQSSVDGWKAVREPMVAMTGFGERGGGGGDDGVTGELVERVGEEGEPV